VEEQDNGEPAIKLDKLEAKSDLNEDQLNGDGLNEEELDESSGTEEPSEDELDESSGVEEPSEGELDESSVAEEPGEEELDESSGADEPSEDELDEFSGTSVLSEDELNDTIAQLCLSKAEEFHLIGYEQVTGADVWECVSDKYHKKGVPPLYEIVNDILSLKITQFMNFVTLNMYRGEYRK